MITLKKSLLAALFFALAAGPAAAQEGHPLTGSWSGERQVNGRDSRVLLVLDLQRDQSLTGYVIENRARIPLKSASLDPEDWSVTLVLEGRDRDGNAVSYEVDGRIENLGSATERAIVGRWSGGGEGGEFHVTWN